MNIFLKAIIFITSPILSFLTNFKNIARERKNKNNIYFLAAFIGFLSALYIPSLTNDKVRYIELYENCQIYGYQYLLLYLLNGRPDFVFHTLIFVFAKFNIPFSILIFGITTLTVGIHLYVFFEITRQEANLKANKSTLLFLGFTLVIISFSLPDLFSGIRFYFASSIILLAFYRRIYLKISSYSLIFLAIIIHFSASLFLVIYLVIEINQKFRLSIARNLFLLSSIIILVPKRIAGNVLLFVLAKFKYLETKTALYVEGEDFIEMGINEGSQNYLFVYLSSILWVVFAYIYLLITKSKINKLRTITYFSFAFINIFYAFTTIFSRYMLLGKFIFLILLYIEQSKQKKQIWLYFFFCLMICNTVINLIVMRNNIASSFLNWHILTLFSLFFDNFDSSDIIE